MKPNRIKFALAVCLFLTACGKDKPPVPPRPIDSANPALVDTASGVKLNTAEPVVPTPPLAVPPLPQAIQTPPPIPANPEPPPPGASAADLQALREAFDRQKVADQASLEDLQDRLAALEQRLVQMEAKPVFHPASNLPQTTSKKAQKPKAAIVSVRRRVLQAVPPSSAEAVPVLPFTVGSVDTWEGEKQVMIRAGGQWRGLKQGDTHDGWRIESTDGQAVTVRSPQGKRWQVEAGQGG